MKYKAIAAFLFAAMLVPVYVDAAGMTCMLKINRNEYYDLCDLADQKGRYR